MKKDSFRVIGVMSGTSLDGIDLVDVSFDKEQENWKYTIHNSQTIDYNKSWEEKLSRLIFFTKDELASIDSEYTLFLAEVVKKFISKNSIDSIDAICSHGHTAQHEPKNGLTYQIGNLPKLAQHIGQQVVCDFRVQDVELGGQGAPLVPIGDKLLFNDYDFCLNLGGFANISLTKENIRLAYDICPVNIVMNHYVKQEGLDYDDEGRIAASGNVNYDLLKQLNAIDFYSVAPPKSLGLEWVKSNIFPLIDSFKLSSNDILRTFAEHVAIQITNQINVIVNFKEAIIFGFLGVLRLSGQVNCLSSVTGAKHDHSSGKIFLP